MKTYRKSAELFCLLLVMFFLLAVTAEAAFIKSSKSYLRESPEIQSKNLLRLDKGEEATILQEQGYWRKIRVRGTTGWVSRLSLSETKRFSKLYSLGSIKKNPNQNQYEVLVPGSPELLSE